MTEIVVVTRPLIVTPEMVKKPTVKVKLAAGNRLLDLNFVLDVNRLGTFVHGYAKRRALPGATTALYQRAHQIMQSVFPYMEKILSIDLQVDIQI